MRAEIDNKWLRVIPETEREIKLLSGLEDASGNVLLCWDRGIKTKTCMVSYKSEKPDRDALCREIGEAWNTIAKKHKLARIRKWSGADKQCVEWLIDAGLDVDLLELIPILPRLDWYMGNIMSSTFVVDLRWLLNNRDRIPGILVMAQRAGEGQQQFGETDGSVL